MRTTVAIEDALLERAKRRARERGMTLGALVEDALRSELAADRSESSGPPIPVFSGGSGPRAGVDLSSNRALLEVLDEDHDLESLR